MKDLNNNENLICSKDLENFGISEGVSEVILTCGYDFPNAAPIGIIQKYDRMFLRLFSGSKTHENLKKENYFAANITKSSLLFAKTAFSNLPESDFTYVSIPEISLNSLKIPVLSDSEGFIIFKCINKKETPDFLFIDIEPIYFKKNSNFGKTFINRGFNSLIDATVHLTRYQVTHDPKYIELITYHQGIIQRCGRPEDKEALLYLKKKMVEFSEENAER